MVMKVEEWMLKRVKGTPIDEPNFSNSGGTVYTREDGRGPGTAGPSISHIDT
jgi:hypothetical protein